MWAIQNSAGLFMKSHTGKNGTAPKFVEEIEKARLFSRKCDASNSVSYWKQPEGWRYRGQSFSDLKVIPVDVKTEIAIQSELAPRPLDAADYVPDARLIALADRVDAYVDMISSRTIYPYGPQEQELERDVLWAVNSMTNGDSGWTWIRSHRAAMSFIAQLLRHNVVVGENLTDGRKL